MVISTQTLADASALMASSLLIDKIQLCTVSEKQTQGYHVTRALTNVGEPIAGLVQTTVLQNAVESNVGSTYSIKMAKGTAAHAGMAVKVVSCVAEPSLVGKVLLIDKVSENGLAMLRKAVASDFEVVNQEGKEGMA